MAMQEVSDRHQLKLDHVLSVPVDLREMKAAQIPNPSIHRTEELMNLHTTELDESNSRISVSVEESKEESDEANTSELAQVCSLILRCYIEMTLPIISLLSSTVDKFCFSI